MGKIENNIFIEKARKIHGERYDYSLVEYTNNRTKINIICPYHGIFKQTPNSHLNGSGCPICANNKQKTTKEDFINMSKIIHNNKYDYSQVEYLNAHTKVIIICPEHGEFMQQPTTHLRGCGCPKCGNREKMTTDSFIEKARKVHGDKYDYSKVEYVNSSIKVDIICPTHGVFKQSPSMHIFGQGCPYCSGKGKLNNEKFIEKARKVHGDRYDYSQVEYVNNNTKVKIICNEHGVFEQTPSNHLYGQGCPYCSGNNRMTTEKFIEKARKVHGDRYDYSQVEYIDSKTKVKIICKKHGVFEQTPTIHLSGSGCQACGGKEKLTTEIFIDKANKVHNNKFDYSKVNYVNGRVKVSIICKEHGVFEQSPASHLCGHGCPKCAHKK